MLNCAYGNFCFEFDKEIYGPFERLGVTYVFFSYLQGFAHGMSSSNKGSELTTDTSKIKGYFGSNPHCAKFIADSPFKVESFKPVDVDVVSSMSASILGSRVC